MMDLDSWKQGSESFTWHNHTLFVKDSGETNKPVLLCIHGFPTASIDWQPLWPALTAHFRCLTLDLLGFGLSDKPKRQAITLMQQADICVGLLRQKAISEVHLLCHDYGDTVGQELLARASEQTEITLRSCIFLNGGLYPGVHRPRFIQKLLMSPIGPLVAKLTSYKKFAGTLQSICTQPIDNADLMLYWDLMTRDGGRAVLPELIKYMQERKVHRLRWGNATNWPPCPVKLINGVDDPISGNHLCDAYETRVANAEVTRLDKVGHYPQVEAPERVLHAAMSFWQDKNVL
ncbi:alpha/beta hydrolase [Alteromonas sediminis]|uniref:Alpha/beta hydrolase n=1 Tax=Alteromonas sediminis TaxID=2259342 RepID=A0A3N5XY93_9ALTE|nr:alpha/beta hydrolase [Alteromonas sediminis]RPJ65902.1 alpha/beta hydrolase [Alteromonas sediminis]